ncbi:MAG: glutamyl-tRNA amidotransferase [Bacteroidetes bacterium HGW-Bacteroidetes-6]|jgi:hypothetical protein|nr:MAG: glutamyl-tRNA amidotransferase [Bacteroidetes bacterium HGW-Bacteroidetes-6]
MSLIDTISSDIMAAMKAREMEKLEALRGIKSALLLANTAEGNKEITAEDELKILQKLVKQRRESAAIYKEQNRMDLYEPEMKQADFIEAYLPAQMSEDDIRKVVADVITQTGATSIKDMGKVMGMASKQLAGKADNSLVSKIVKELLG